MLPPWSGRLNEDTVLVSQQHGGAPKLFAGKCMLEYAEVLQVHVAIRFVEVECIESVLHVHAG